MLTSIECERSEACPNPSLLLQPVLGTDKRNPIFTVCRQAGTAPSLHVYYGAELLEVVPDDRQHPAFKLLLARLYNAGVKGLALQRSFQVDRKTMQRWGQALQSGDGQQLVRALAGRGGHRKLTPEIRAFVRVRLPEIYAQSRAGYSQRLRAEIERVFNVGLSGECLRPLLKSLRAELRQELSQPVAQSGVENRETAWVGAPEPSTLMPVEVPAEPLSVAPLVPPPPDIRKESPVLPVPAPAPVPHCGMSFCHHLGVLLFSAALSGMEKEVAASGWLLKQWLATLLLGAVNIEQTKLLDFEDLRRLLGRTLRSLFPQRSQLTQLASGSTVSQLLSFNAQWAQRKRATSILILTQSIIPGCRTCSRAGALAFDGPTKCCTRTFFTPPPASRCIWNARITIRTCASVLPPCCHAFDRPWVCPPTRW